MIDPEQFIDYVSHHPYLGLAVLIIPSGLGLPIPEDISLIVAGYLCYKFPHDASLWVMIPWALFLVVGSDLLLFYLGRFVGDKIVKVPVLRYFLTPERLKWSEEMFEAYGGGILFMARFMPGLRAPLFFTAGHLKVPFWKVLLYDGGAALLSVPAIILAAWYYGDQFDMVKSMVRQTEKYGIIAVLVTVVVVVVVIKLKKRFINWLSDRAHEKITHKEEEKKAKDVP